MLTITTLGSLDVSLNGKSCLDYIGAKGALLVVYLVETGVPQEHRELARLLWPDEEDAEAMAQLHALILKLQVGGCASYLEITESHITWTSMAEVDYDVARLRNLTHHLEGECDHRITLNTTMFLKNGQSDDLAAWLQRAATAFERQHQAPVGGPLQPAEAHGNSSHQSISAQPFFGRQYEAAQLTHFLDSGHRLISVIGIGGTGKTSFVRSQMPMLRQRFNDNVFFVDLRSVGIGADSPEDAVLRTIRLTLPPSTLAAESLFDQVVGALRAKPCCLVLDNFETVIDAALLLIHLIQATPHVTILVTSRVALYLSNESRLHLVGFAVEERRRQPRNNEGIDSEAVGFFVHCARRFHANFAPNEENIHDIRAICRLVAGVPLAIELAALQLDVFSLPELRERLKLGIDVLTTGAEDLPGNHHSMRALLDGMWQALDHEAQQTLAELSVLANSWHRDAMQAVAPTTRSVFETLRNVSMLHVDEPAWFSMHPLIRQYAAERLRTDYDADAPARRHAAHFLGFLALDEQPLSWTQCQSPSVLAMLQRRIFDIEIAWQWAVAHSDWAALAKSLVTLTHLYILSGQAPEGSRLLSNLLRALPPEPERTPLQIQLAGRSALFLSYLGILQGDRIAARPWAKVALRWLDAAGTPHDQAAVRFHALWRSLQYPEELNAAINMVPKALELTSHPQHLLLRSRILAFNALMDYVPSGEWPKATASAREVITAMAGVDPITLDVLVAAAGILCVCLRFSEAGKVLQTISALTNRHSQHSTMQLYDTSSIMSAYLHASLSAIAGELDDAVAIMERTLPLYCKHNAGQASVAYGFLALCLARRGEMANAIETARTGLIHSEKVGGRYLIAYAQLRLAEVLILAGSSAEAVMQLLPNVLSTGLDSHNTTLIFSSLYAMVIGQKDAFPSEFRTTVLKIGAASPALNFEMHPLAEEHLHAEGIVLTQEERSRLYQTDLDTVTALARQMIAVR